jgi:hypothetical protein
MPSTSKTLPVPAAAPDTPICVLAQAHHQASQTTHSGCARVLLELLDECDAVYRRSLIVAQRLEAVRPLWRAGSPRVGPSAARRKSFAGSGSA